jgi:hypothetical protein
MPGLCAAANMVLCLVLLMEVLPAQLDLRAMRTVRLRQGRPLNVKVSDINVCEGITT